MKAVLVRSQTQRLCHLLDLLWFPLRWFCVSYLNQFLLFLPSDLSHSQSGCQVYQIIFWQGCRANQVIIFFFHEKMKEKANIDRDSLSWQETRGQFAPHSSWYYSETVEHWFSQCCDSCSCLADICFHPSPCSDGFTLRAVEVRILSMNVV